MKRIIVAVIFVLCSMTMASAQVISLKDFLARRPIEAFKPGYQQPIPDPKPTTFTRQRVPWSKTNTRINTTMHVVSLAGALSGHTADLLESKHVVYQIHQTSRGVLVTCESVGAWRAADGCGFNAGKYAAVYYGIVLGAELLEPYAAVIADTIKLFLTFVGWQGYAAGMSASHDGVVIGRLKKK